MCDKTLRGDTMAKAALAAAAAGAPMPKSWCPASRSSQSNLRNSASRQIITKPCFFARTVGNMKISVEVKSGSRINMITESAADYFGFEVIVDDLGFSDYSLDDDVLLISLVDQTQIVGLTSFPLLLEGCELWFEGVVVQDHYLANAHVDVIAGAPFMEQNDVSVRPSKQQIMFGDDVTCYYGSSSPHDFDLSLTCLHGMEGVNGDDPGCLTSDGQHDDYDPIIKDLRNEGCEMNVSDNPHVDICYDNSHDTLVGNEHTELDEHETSEGHGMLSSEKECVTRENKDLGDQSYEIGESVSPGVETSTGDMHVWKEDMQRDDRCETIGSDDIGREISEDVISYHGLGTTCCGDDLNIDHCKVIGETKEMINDHVNCDEGFNENDIDGPSYKSKVCQLPLLLHSTALYTPAEEDTGQLYFPSVFSKDGANSVSIVECNYRASCHDNIAFPCSRHMPCTPSRELCFPPGNDFPLESSMVVANSSQPAVFDSRFIESVDSNSSLDYGSTTLHDVTMVTSDINVPDRCIGSNCSVDRGGIDMPHFLSINISERVDTNLPVVPLKDPKLPHCISSSCVASDGGIVAPLCLPNEKSNRSSSAQVSPFSHTTCCVATKLPLYPGHMTSSTVTVTVHPHLASSLFVSNLHDSSILPDSARHTRPSDQPHAASSFHTEHGPADLSVPLGELCRPGVWSSLPNGRSSTTSLAPGACVRDQRLPLSISRASSLADLFSDVFPFCSPRGPPTVDVIRGCHRGLPPDVMLRMATTLLQSQMFMWS